MLFRSGALFTVSRSEYEQRVREDDARHGTPASQAPSHGSGGNCHCSAARDCARKPPSPPPTQRTQRKGTSLSSWEKEEMELALELSLAEQHSDRSVYHPTPSSRIESSCHPDLSPGPSTPPYHPKPSPLYHPEPSYPAKLSYAAKSFYPSQSP